MLQTGLLLSCKASACGDAKYKEASCTGSEDTADIGYIKGQQGSEAAAHPALLSLHQAAPVPVHHAGA